MVLIENDTEKNFNDNIFSDKMKDVITKNVYISFYNEWYWCRSNWKEKKNSKRKQTKYKQYTDKEIMEIYIYLLKKKL